MSRSRHKYPVVVFGVECHSNEDVQRAAREYRDDPARDRTPLRFTITTVETVEIDPMWLDDLGRVAWVSSPLEVGGETPLADEHRRTPDEYLAKARRIAGSTFKGVGRKVNVKPSNRK